MEVIEIAKRIDGWKLQELLSDLAKKSRAGLATPELKWQIKEADQRLPATAENYTQTEEEFEEPFNASLRLRKRTINGESSQDLPVLLLMGRWYSVGGRQIIKPVTFNQLYSKEF